MSTCPVCLGPMETLYRNKIPRVYCSRKCVFNRKTIVTFPDPVVVQRLIDGDRLPKATRIERILATEQLTNSGYSLRAIAKRMHTTKRTISKYRNALKG